MNRHFKWNLKDVGAQFVAVIIVRSVFGIWISVINFHAFTGAIARLQNFNWHTRRRTFLFFTTILVNQIKSQRRRSQSPKPSTRCSLQSSGTGNLA